MVDNELLLDSALQGFSDGITSFAVAQDGELHLLTLGAESVIQKLTICDKDPGEMPMLLSQTGIFTDLATMTSSRSSIPYNVNTQLWSERNSGSRLM